MNFAEMILLLAVLVICWIALEYCLHKTFQCYENAVDELNRQHKELEILKRQHEQLEKISNFVDAKIKNDGEYGE
jgi:hypothetical protein